MKNLLVTHQIQSWHESFLLTMPALKRDIAYSKLLPCAN